MSEEDKAYLRDVLHIPETSVSKIEAAAKQTTIRYNNAQISFDSAVTLIGRPNVLNAITHAALHVKKIIILPRGEFVIFNALNYFLKQEEIT